MSSQPAWLIDLIREEVHERVWTDPRTVEKPGTLLGWPRDRIYSEVLKGGQADFDEPVGHLSGADRALLYANYNLPRHRDELCDAFEQLFRSSALVGAPTLIDLGCGPFTAGLALAATLEGKSYFHYHGFDRASSMLELGQRLAESAARRGAFHGRTTWHFAKDLDGHDFGRIRNDTTIIVASYLLASVTVQVEPLVSSVLSSLHRIGPGPVALLYTNSAKDWPNRNFDEFKEALMAGGFTVVSDAVERFQRTKAPAGLRYALLFREGQGTVPLGGGGP
jgi:hypothetical protein